MPNHYLFRKPAMISRRVAEILFRGMRLREQAGVAVADLRGETVSWRVTRGIWTTVHWFTVTSYAPELFRLRNDVIASIPRKIWPFPRPERDRFELTFHCSEIAEDLGQPLFAFCSVREEPKVILDWPLFEGESTYPGYAWTQKARQFVEQSQKS